MFFSGLLETYSRTNYQSNDNTVEPFVHSPRRPRSV